MALEIAPDADKAILDADAALLARAVENLLHNAACHNPGPVQVQLSAVRTGKTLRITIGVGDVPPAAFPQNRVFRRAAGRVCPAPAENAIFFYSHKKIILILVDFLGITLYNVYYK